MNAEQIAKMSDAELDKYLAEKTGWTDISPITDGIETYGSDWAGISPRRSGAEFESDSNDDPEPTPAFTRDIAAAMGLLDGRYYQIEKSRFGNEITVMIWVPKIKDYVFARGPELKRAISEAVAQAMESDGGK